jgi:transposase
MIHRSSAPRAASALIVSLTGSNPPDCRAWASVQPPISATGAAAADTNTQVGVHPTRTIGKDQSSMTHPERIVYGGVDTHQDVHVGAVIDATGRLLGTRAYPTTPIGLRGMARWMTGQGTVAMVGVEGTGTYGLGLQRVLQQAGVQVVEVNRPNRQLRRTRGESDTVDAEAAARAVLAGHATVVPKARDGIVESIRVLRIALESSRRSRTRVGAQIRHLVLTAPERLHLELAPLPVAEQAARAARFRPGDDTTDVRDATRAALRVLARQYQSLTADMGLLSAELDTLTTQANPGLRQLRGAGQTLPRRCWSPLGTTPNG